MDSANNSEWLNEVLDEVGLQQFYSKLTNDLQLTKLSHFDFVTENDLIQLGLSRPAAKRLLAAIKKRKSFVTALKNKIVNRLIPTTSTSSTNHSPYPNSISTPSSKGKHDSNLSSNSHQQNSNGNKNSTDFSHLTCLINSQDVQIKEEIGHGVHGFVKKGEWTTPNGRVVEVAVKILRKDVMAEPGATFNDFVKEISVMHQLNHPNIIKLYGVVLSSPMMMVTELAPYGNLRDRLRKENGATPISQLINFGVQITSGMEYLESRRFVHRDLAARNIFISHGRKILIGDLGLMRAIPTQEDHYVMSEKTKIPYPWCAPESLRFKQFSSASDVYMFGVTLWEMFSFGKEPWTGLNLNEILENISTTYKRLPCPRACPTMVYQTLLQCWNIDPTCRPNFSTLYQYLSTSYPLEVRSTQHISEVAVKRIDGNLVPNDNEESYFSSNNQSSKDNDTEPQRRLSISDGSQRNILNCNVDDRILVIDGQPEKYWWKGQNQRTFEIGWFPLCSTRWMAPKRGANYISKPLKNSFIHAGHCGKEGSWGNPWFTDYMGMGRSSKLNSVNLDANQHSLTVGINNLEPKNRTKSKLSKLFGISDSSSSGMGASQFMNKSSPTESMAQLLPHSYQRFCNEGYQATSGAAHKGLNRRNSTTMTGTNNFIKSFSNEKVDDGSPLIDLSDEVTIPVSQSSMLNSNFCAIQQEAKKSLIDMDNNFPETAEGESLNLQRHFSDTKLNQLPAPNYNAINDDADDNYRLSWAGSWNTGTFDGGSNGNIYSNYYCPADEVNNCLSGVNLNHNINLEGHSIIPTNVVDNRYYSAVTHEELGNNIK